MNINDWLADAKPGERFVYFSGHLAAAREESRTHTRNAKFNWTWPALEAAESAWQAHEAGLVRLVQKRMPDRGAGFDYIAVRAKDPRR